MTHEKKNTLFPREEEPQGYFKEKIQTLEERCKQMEKALAYEAAVNVSLRNDLFNIRKRLHEYHLKLITNGITI